MQTKEELIGENDGLFLCFINFIGEDSEGFNMYEFIFTDNIDEVWGENFDQKPACLVNNLIVSSEYVTEAHIVKMKQLLSLIQHNCCFGMQDCMDGVVSLASSDINDMDNLLVFDFGESFDECQKKLAEKSIVMR